MIAHGCNCFCTQGAGIALQMSNVFKTNDAGTFDLESSNRRGDINKLGQIQYKVETRAGGTSEFDFFTFDLAIVNCYTQYCYGTNKRHLDYDALSLCLKKINHQFKGKKIGLPIIGGGLAGGDVDIILKEYELHLQDVDLTVVVL